MRVSLGLALSASLLLAGCGMTVPRIEDFNQKIPEGLEENTIVNQVKCELHVGVQEALANPMPNGNSIAWLKDWAAKVSMTLTVDEKGAVAPGLTFTSPFEKASQTFGLDLGASASAQATRQETIQFTYAFSDLLAEGHITPPCANETGTLIHSDLKIAEFIQNKAMIAQIPDAVVAGKALPGSPYQTFNDKITFVVATNASITPSFKLVRFAVNSKASLLSATRTKTQDILITLSAKGTPATKDRPATLNDAGEAVHSAGLIGNDVGQAVSNALRNLNINVP